jgi:hypothetical protein
MKFQHLHEARNYLEERERRLLQAYARYGKERLRQRKRRAWEQVRWLLGRKRL